MSYYVEQVKRLGIHFLECDAFSTADKTCCKDCHERDHSKLIFIRPMREDGLNPDWTLGLEAMVCCELYDYVRALPREWWTARAKELGIERTDMRGYSYSKSSHLDTEKSHVEKVSKPATRRKTIAQEEEAEGLHSFLSRFK